METQEPQETSYSKWDRLKLRQSIKFFKVEKKDWLIKMSGFAWSPDKLSSVCLWCENMERPATNTNESPSPFSLSWFFSPVFQTFQHTWMACVVCRCLARLSPHIACDSCSPWINDSRCSWSENLEIPEANTSPVHFLFLNQLLQQSLALNHLWRGLPHTF